MEGSPDPRTDGELPAARVTDPDAASVAPAARRCWAAAVVDIRRPPPPQPARPPAAMTWLNAGGRRVRKIQFGRG